MARGEAGVSVDAMTSELEVPTQRFAAMCIGYVASTHPRVRGGGRYASRKGGGSEAFARQRGAMVRKLLQDKGGATVRKLLRGTVRHCLP